MEIVSWANFRHRFRLKQHVATVTEPAGNTLAALVVRDNIRRRRAIEEAYLEAIAEANEEIIIANAYFLPGLRFRHALVAAAGRGVRVSILLQGRVEYRLLHYATQALYGALVNAGIHVFEYHRSFLHAKVAVVDGQWATVGSSNIDPFSLLLAKEANVVARCRGFAGTLRQSLLTAIDSGARELSHADLRGVSWLARVLRWGSYQLTRLLIGVAGYGRLH